MKIIINTSLMVPIYEQIVDQIKMLIRNGELKENDNLPSVRTLSKELKISALTVKKAYDNLESEGFTVTVHGKGTYVAATNTELLLEEQKKELEADLEQAIQKGRRCGISDEDIKRISHIYIVACGSAYHTGVVTQYVMEDLARVPVRVELASEFRYRRPILDKDDLVIVVSQSGETADTLAGLRLAKEQEVKTLGIVNVVGSSIAREADNVFYTLAGPEISVATTKAYSAQLIAGYLLSIEFAKVREQITEKQYFEYIEELLSLIHI